jgi:hypothetical protein
LALSQFGLHVTAKVAYCKQIAEILHPRIGFKLGQIGPRHTLLEFRKSVGIDFAVLDKVALGQDILGKQILGLDFDSEGLFQLENDI